MAKSLSGLFLFFAVLSTGWLTVIVDGQDAEELPLAFREDFEAGISRWEVLDPDSWRLKKEEDDTTFEITSRESAYMPKVRSPLHVAIVKDVEVGDFELRLRVRSTKDTGGHRDCCVFFGFKDPTHFYYAHLGAKPDPQSSQIMLVNDAPRAPLTMNENEIPWDDRWHLVKVIRKVETGLIQVFFDDMEHPVMEVTDKTLGRGRVGIGSFDDMNEFDDIKLHGK